MDKFRGFGEYLKRVTSVRTKTRIFRSGTNYLPPCKEIVSPLFGVRAQAFIVDLKLLQQIPDRRGGPEGGAEGTFFFES